MSQTVLLPESLLHRPLVLKNILLPITKNQKQKDFRRPGICVNIHLSTVNFLSVKKTTPLILHFSQRWRFKPGNHNNQ